MISPEFVVTLDQLDGYDVVAELGNLTASAARPRSMLREAFRGIGLFIGLAPTEYRSDAEYLRADCLAELCRKADELGANGIVSVQFNVREEPEGSTSVAATGRAVVLEALN
ncbi:MAG: YbjQ family protein [Candidatus Eremiobacteraeota bacterium]|nr:YbjQ family protein [Candidatus Eremiobacteraeota bacterium]